MIEYCCCDGDMCPVVRCHQHHGDITHSDARSMASYCHTVYCSYIAGHYIVITDQSEARDDELWPIRGLYSVLPVYRLASVNIEASDPSSCLLSHDNNIYCQPQNMKIWIKQDNALPYLNEVQHNFSPSSSFAIKQISPALLFIVNGVSQTGLSEHVNPWRSC